MSHRDKATIEYVRPCDDNDHGGFSFHVGLDYVEGGHQALGGFHLDCALAMAELCDLFGVSRPDELVNKTCYALKHFDGWNEFIDGIETAKGKRWLMKGFCKRHIPGYKEVDPLSDRARSITRSIESLHRDIARHEEELATLKEHYHVWEESR